MPSAPRELDAHHTNGAGTNGIQNIELEWLAPEDTGGTSLTGYRIYRGFTPDGLTHYGDAPGDALKWEDEHCPLGHVCFYEVAAVNIAGEGPRSNQASEVGTVPPL